MKLKLFIALLSVPILVISFLISFEIRENLNCKAVKSERDASNQKVLSYEAMAIKEWDSFPLMGDGTEARDPSPNSGGRYYSNFENFYQSEYLPKLLKEKNIGHRLVLNYPECFSLREVVEIQEILND